MPKLRKRFETLNDLSKGTPIMLFGNEILNDVETASVLTAIQMVIKGNTTKDYLETNIEGYNALKAILITLTVTKLHINHNNMLESIREESEDEYIQIIEQAHYLAKQK